jgi:3-methyladenine DNA glycosylase AlkD
MMLEKKLGVIRKFCQANADEAIVKKYAWYFKEGYDAYGLAQKLMETQRERWLKDWRDELGLEGFLALGDLLVATGKYEEGIFALWFVAQFRDEFTPKTLQRLAVWLDQGLRNWAHTDVFSRLVLSHFVTRRVVPLEAFADWRAGPSKWRRRAVPVTLISAVKAGFAVAPLLGFVAPMMMDAERVVQQGLGWFLREAWKKSPSPTEKFLLRWKDRCGRVIVQYATEKMPVAKKAQFKKRRTD